MDTRAYDLAGRKVVVTGGAGFIGSHTVDLLAQSGCSEIAVVDDMVRGRPENLVAAGTRAPVRLIEGDICDREVMEGAVQGADTVFHLAALRITQCATEPRRALEVMVDATYDLLDLCVRSHVRKVVMASSASVYGMAAEFPTAERHHPYANRTFYGAAKAFGEGMLRSFNDMYGLHYVALRYFNVYGPRMDIYGRYTEVLVRWIERLEAGLPPVIFGDGNQTMDLVHVADIARANLLASTMEPSDVALNVGSGTETSLLELASIVSRVMGRDQLRPIYEPERAINPVSRRLADIEAARELIGFAASVPLEEGLKGVVDWWRGRQGEVALGGGKEA